MPAADSSNPPSANNSSSASDEASQLELHLQRQLEEDVARIFDESIYTDLEVVCGKLKILTHSCILRARTDNFYRVLETILHVNFGRSAFDEVYSFISDTYTECNLKHQEKEILQYLKSISSSFNNKKGGEEPEDHFLTPKCVSPYIEKGYKKTVSSSPSTELTKEYYSLVPIENNLLDKELIEQDELSSAFQSIISLQSKDLDKLRKIQRNKPTSLALVSSHSLKSVEHSHSCDILIKSNLRDDVLFDTGKKRVDNKEIIGLSQNKNLESGKPSSFLCKDTKPCYPESEKVGETAYSPDSLITDDLSSSSDYLSAAYACSPGVAPVCAQQLNVETNIAKMENIFTSSDSGLENTGLLESLTSHKDVTLTDMSLTESTLHELTTDDGSNSHDSVSNPLVEKEMLTAPRPDTSVIDSNSQTSHNSERPNEFTCNSSKEEKQRQNEEIVILESSSLSSETGSWESVFPPKLPTQKVCEKFINSERHHFTEREPQDPLKRITIPEPSESYADVSQIHVLKSAFKSTSCFIDAASLADEEDDTNNVVEIVSTDALIPMPSRPVPCSTNRTDISPNDGSENDNEDSLEQLESRDPDSIQKDLSPTIFEMTPITEDSLCTNAFEQTQDDNDALVTENKQVSSNANCTKDEPNLSNNVFMSNTPHNSIMSLKVSALKQYESEESESDTTVTGRESQKKTHNCQKYSESSPIISGGASVDDHLPTIGSYSGSPFTRRRIENIPIVSGAYSYMPAAEVERQAKSPRPSCANAWVVDMSSANKSDTDKIGSNQTHNTKKPTDKACNSLRNSSKNSSSLENCSKSRSSVDSDSSERSSHKFYIDLSTLPNPITPKNQTESKKNENASEKKNMFSMYIDFSEKSILKEIPARLTTMSTTKNNTNEPKDSTKSKIPNEITPANVAKIIETNSTSIFEKYESLCEDPNISISEIIGLPEKDRKEVKQNDPKNTESNEKKEMERRNHCGERPFHRNPRSTIHEESVADQEVEPFVRLSDLDKPVQKAEPPFVINPVRTLGERMTRSIPENNWCEQQNQASTSRSNEIVSSFHSENALSLNRLFPHLRNEFSRSMPGSLSSRTRSPLRSGACSSPGDMEDQASDTSEMSSVQSSFCRSNVENSTTEETSQASSLLSNCQSRLGQDLLRMFLEEIAPDVIVEVSGRRIKAHKCILSSRCQYFAGILSGGWVESAGNVIALPPFSYNVVHFALCHIYSGVSTIPDAISIVELATLADMLGLEGLKEAIMFTLKAKYCHHFHQPCAVCKAGVLECFPLCSVYGLDDLYRKCLDWIIKYFPWVFPTKAFATLPTELLDKCYQEMVSNMTIENVISTVYGIGLTGVCVTSQEDLTRVRWGEVVIRLCRRLIHAAARLIAPKLMNVFRELGTLPPDPPPTVKKAVDDCITAAIEWAPCGEACSAYHLLTRIAKDIRNNRHVRPDLLTNGNNPLGINNMLYANALNWVMHCESAVVRAAPRVCTTSDFMELPIELRRRLRELGCISYGQPPVVGAVPALQLNRRSRSTTQSKPNKPHGTTATSHSRNTEIDQVRASFVPYAPKPPRLSAETVANGDFNVHLQEAIRLSYNTAPPVRTTKAQEERAKFNLSKTKTTSQERLSAKAPKTSFENTKPRYLEPKVCPEHFKKTLTAPKLPNRISSSESSRNSSPIQARNLRTSRMKTRQVNEATKAQALSQDSLATSSRPRTAEPSTDSLSESQTSNKYATYTKPKKPATKGSVESIKCAKSAAAPNPSTAAKAKLKTKIPVYLNSLSKSQTSDRKSSTGNTTKASTNTTTNSSASLPTRSKAPEKNSSCSLMNATKSSQAKMVTKVVKGATKNKPAQKNAKNNPKMSQRRGDEPPADIPVMERSGTFLKDEPTFGKKTKNIDLDQ